jgi:tRNA (guanosine-2'-O-)-methyltransferase
MSSLQSEEYLAWLREQISPHKAGLFQSMAAQRTRKICVVLEDIYQPHNASAVLRTCEALGVQDVHVIENQNVFETKPQVSLGASRWLSIYRYQDGPNPTETCLNQLKNAGYTLWATSPHQDDKELEEIEPDSAQPIALMLGTEKLGLSARALEMADGFLRIPMYGLTESFNISVSAAICLHHLNWKLRKKSGWELSTPERINLEIEWCERATRRSEALRTTYQNL